MLTDIFWGCPVGISEPFSGLSSKPASLEVFPAVFNSNGILRVIHAKTLELSVHQPIPLAIHLMEPEFCNSSSLQCHGWATIIPLLDSCDRPLTGHLPSIYPPLSMFSEEHPGWSS